MLDEGVLAYLAEHANEIATQAENPYQPIGGIPEEFSEADEPLAAPAATTTSSGSGAGAAARKAPSKKT